MTTFSSGFCVCFKQLHGDGRRYRAGQLPLSLGCEPFAACRPEGVKALTFCTIPITIFPQQNVKPRFLNDCFFFLLELHANFYCLRNSILLSDLSSLPRALSFNITTAKSFHLNLSKPYVSTEFSPSILSLIQKIHYSYIISCLDSLSIF